MDPWNGPAIRPECAGSGRVDDTAIKKKKTLHFHAIRLLSWCITMTDIHLAAVCVPRWPFTIIPN